MICNVLEYLEEAAKEVPERVALRDERRDITYEEWKEGARRIGSALGRRTEGARPIAVFIDRDVRMLVLFLGIVYSGNFYVPVSKQLPGERIRQILHQVQPEAVLCVEEDREENIRFIPMRS